VHHQQSLTRRSSPTTSARLSAGRPAASQPAVYQMAYFPPEEYERAWAHDLLDATSYRDHGDYRREIEQTVQALAGRGAGPIRIVALDVPDLLAYAQREGQDPASRQTRLAYTGWRYDTGHHGDLWPPERNAPCWCGSGTKYKKCCGNPVFLAVEPADPASLILRIGLDGVTPEVWRRVAIPSNTPLDVVHRMIQDAMGWDDEHLYVFESGEDIIIDPRSTSGGIPADGERLVSIAAEAGASFSYVYDFGDEWTHTATVEEIRPGGSGNVYEVLDGGGACPPEDCGGPAGYQYLLDALADASSPDHDDAVQRLGADYDPTRWPGVAVRQP
jgi:Plasmid pRiA4b ORF-3-like protein/SEC-C motif